MYRAPPREYRGSVSKTFDVHFVDDRLVQRPVQRLIVSPIESGIDHHGSWHVRRAVFFADRLAVGTNRVRQNPWTPGHAAPDPTRAPIHEQLRGDAHKAARQPPPPPHPKT